MFLFEQKRQKLTAPELRAQNVQKKIPSKQRRKKNRQNNEGKSLKRQKITAHELRAQNVQQKIPSKQSREKIVKTTQPKDATSRVW